jgi:hypothetical protein
MVLPLTVISPPSLYGGMPSFSGMSLLGCIPMAMNRGIAMILSTPDLSRSSRAAGMVGSQYSLKA